MKLISGIHIKYFRSIYDLEIGEISETVTVFTGKNDVGKSNILRALNLFFHNHTDIEERVLFERDFSRIKRKEIQERSKKRQIISVAVQIQTPTGYKSLPKSFWVTKNFDRYNKPTDFTYDSDIRKGQQTAAATRLLNSIIYTYIPAIKDKDTFAQVLTQLKMSLSDFSKNLNMKEFNEKLKEYGEELRLDLQNNIGLSPYLTLPATIQELFSSLDFSIEDDSVTTSLLQRGDGIRCRFIPAIMNYIAQNSKKRHIWGLEEPENSLEFSKAMELNDTTEQQYSKKSQIFITSHSPAFVGDIQENSKKIIYLMSRDINGKVNGQKIERSLLLFNDDKISLSEELGYIFLQRDLAKVLSEKIRDLKLAQAEYEKLAEDLSNTKKRFILFVEGESDKTLIEAAWRKINPISNLPIYIHTCFAASQIRTILLHDTLAAKSPNKTFIGLFDFDSAYNDFHGVTTTKNGEKKQAWEKIQNDESDGILYKKRTENIYALLLPRPDFRKDYASTKLAGESRLSIELLFENQYLDGFVYDKDCTGGGVIKQIFSNRKALFADSSKKLPEKAFNEFRKIFRVIEFLQREN
jgi:predicted ATP-dependent endonuclease of OLD family